MPLKLKAQKPENRQVKLVPSPTSGVVPPVEHRFKPGQSGNPGGRPKLLTDAIQRKLNEKIKVPVYELVENDDPKTKRKKPYIRVKTGMKEITRAEAVADTLIENACTYFPHSVGAFREIREVIEPKSGDSNSGVISGDNLIRLIELFGRRMPKIANAIEV